MNNESSAPTVDLLGVTSTGSARQCSLLDDDEVRAFLSADETGPRPSSRESFELSGDANSSLRIPSPPHSPEGTLLETSHRVDEHPGQPQDFTASDHKVMPKRTECPPTVLWKFWLFEALSLLTGLLSLIAILFILFQYNNEKPPPWPSYINLSTVVALLATLLRSMLVQALAAVIGHSKWSWYSSPRPLRHMTILDEATRGPWGSTRLLFSIPRLNLITLAVITTIASIGVGAFTQQSIRTYACSMAVVGENVSLPIAQLTTSGFNVLPWPGASTNLSKFDTGMQGATIAGLAGLQTTVPFKCPTGNCSFPMFTAGGFTYSTVALDASCFDSSSLLDQTGPVSWPTNATYTNHSMEWATYSFGGTTISYNLAPGSPFLYIERWHPAVQLTSTSDPPALSPEQEAIRNVSPPNLRLGILIPRNNPCASGADPLYENDQDESQPVPAVNKSLCAQAGVNVPRNNVTSFPGSFALTAAACYIYPSLRTYTAGTIENGQLQERLVGTPIPLTPTGRLNTLDISYFAFPDSCVIDGKVYTSSNYSMAPGELITIPAWEDLGNITGPKQCLYALPQGWSQALSDTLGGLFTTPSDGDCVVTANYSNIICTDKWWISTLYNHRNASVASIGQFFQGLADTLTTQLRTIGTDWEGNPNASVLGVMLRTDVCTKIRWLWLLFPAVITALTALLLAVVVWNGRSHGVSMPWKTSLLPLLYYGLSQDQRTGSDGDRLLSEDRLEKMAEDVKVDFSLAGDGWRFHAVG